MRDIENSRRVPYLQSVDFYEFTVTCVALVVATVLLVAPLFIELSLIHISEPTRPY